jgi:hypothetical protein
MKHLSGFEKKGYTNPTMRHELPGNGMGERYA